MVTVLGKNEEPTFLKGFSQNAGAGLRDAFAQIIERKKDQERQELATQKQRAQAEALGIDPDVYDPGVIKELLKQNRAKELYKALGLGQQSSGLENRLGAEESPEQMNQPSISPMIQQEEPMRQPAPRKAPANAPKKQEKQPLWNMLSDQQKVLYASQSPEEAKIMQKEADSFNAAQTAREEKEHKRFVDERDFNFKRAEPTLKEANEERRSIPLKRQSISEIKEAAASGKLEFGKDYLADVFGFEPLRSLEGARFKTAMKDFFLEDLKRAGNRPNQWIEQQLSDALAKVGRSTEANLIWAETAEFKTDLQEERLKELRRLESEDMKEHGFVKGDIGERADEAIRDYAEQRQKELGYSIRQIQEKSNPKLLQSLDPVKKGTPLTLEKAKYLVEEFGDQAEDVAEKLGYELPDEKTLERFM